MYGRGGVNVFDPDYDEAPLFRDAVCYEGRVTPGQMLFYPGEWWHSTRVERVERAEGVERRGGEAGAEAGVEAEAGFEAEAPSISLSALVVNGDNFRRVKAALDDSCGVAEAEAGGGGGGDGGGGGASGRAFPEVLCAKLAGCYGQWEHMWDSGS